MQPELVRLAATLAGVQDVGPAGGAPPACDFYCPIMSLPRAFGTTLETIPAVVPYFAADPAAVARWRQRLGLTFMHRMIEASDGFDLHIVSLDGAAE